MGAFYALLAVLVLAGTGAAILAACGVLTVTVRRPSGAQREAWREAGRAR
jgi:hypothetical protein